VYRFRPEARKPWKIAEIFRYSLQLLIRGLMVRVHQGALSELQSPQRVAGFSCLGNREISGLYRLNLAKLALSLYSDARGHLWTIKASMNTDT
jgi:hypothetical protein